MRVIQGLSEHLVLITVIISHSVTHAQFVCTAGTTGGNAGGANCNFPFIYQGNSYSACTTVNHNQLWCATVPDYDADKTWGNCITDCEVPSCPVPTTGGSGGGADCVFPFSFGGREYNQCHTTGGISTVPWCATTSDWDRDALWGNCIIYSTRDNMQCVFPFTYQGTQYSECTTAGRSDGLLWCGVVSVVVDFDASSSDWGYCQLDGVCEGTPSTPPMVTPTSPSCNGEITTTGGNGGGANCVFPYLYRGDEYLECITNNNNGVPWCATTYNYDDDKLWGNCGEVSCSTVSTSSTESPVTPVSPDDCVDTFELVEGVLSYQGSLQNGVLTVEACMVACLADSDCVAYDWSSNVRCFLHEDGYLSRLNDNAPNVDQYRRQSCVASTTGTGSPDTGSTPVCVDDFMEFEATNAFGGMRIREATNLEECTASCLADPDCLAFDLTAGGTKCFLHYEGYLNRLSNSAFSVQYRRIACETSSSVTGTGVTQACEDNFVQYENTLALGGDRSDTAMTVADCQDECLADSTCIAIDFNTIKNLCYLHDELSGVMTDVNAVDQYRREGCVDVTDTTIISGGPCEDTFEIMANTLAFDGAPLGAMPLGECQDICRGVDTCVAIDYNRLNMKCFWHVAGYEDQRRDSLNIDQYVRVSCQQSSTGTGISGGTTIAGTSECVDDFMEFDDTNAFSGMRIFEATNLEECTDSCLADADCLAFDLTGGGVKCFLHYEGYLNRLGNSAFSVQYRRIPCETSSSVTGTGMTQGCMDTFEEVENTLSLGGNAEGTVDDVDACAAICVEDDECLAFDFNSVTNKCFTHTAGYLDRLGATEPANINQYRREFCNPPTGGSTAIGGGTSVSTATQAPGVESSTPECVDDFMEFDDTNAFSGMRIFEATNLEECTDSCLADPDCLAFDLTAGGTKCFLHFEGYLDRLGNSAFSVQYRRIPCEASSSVTGTGVTQGCSGYTEFPNTRASGGDLLSGPNTVDECKDECTADSDCLGFDFNRNTDKCFAFYDASFLGTVVEGVEVIDQYRKNIDCGVSVSGFISSTNTPVLIPITETDSPNTDCDNFILMDDMMSTGGVLMSPTNLEDCLSLCMNTVDCEAIDYVVADNECYTHTEGYLDNVRTDISGTLQYRRNFC